MNGIGLWYWLFLVFGVILQGGLGYQGRAANQWWWGPSLLQTILFVLIGLKLFGLP
jgi:hypothetical protein